MPPYIENPYCYIVTKLQCDVSKKCKAQILFADGGLVEITRLNSSLLNSV